MHYLTSILHPINHTLIINSDSQNKKATIRDKRFEMIRFDFIEVLVVEIETYHKRERSLMDYLVRIAIITSHAVIKLTVTGFSLIANKPTFVPDNRS